MQNQSSTEPYWENREILFDGRVAELPERMEPREIYCGSPDGGKFLYRIVAWGVTSHQGIKSKLTCRLAFERYGVDAMGVGRWRPLSDRDSVKQEDLICAAVGSLVAEAVR
jgi:hypothetical protein